MVFGRMQLFFIPYTQYYSLSESGEMLCISNNLIIIFPLLSFCLESKLYQNSPSLESDITHSPTKSVLLLFHTSNLNGQSLASPPCFPQGLYQKKVDSTYIDCKSIIQLWLISFVLQLLPTDEQSSSRSQFFLKDLRLSKTFRWRLCFGFLIAYLGLTTCP